MSDGSAVASQSAAARTTKVAIVDQAAPRHEYAGMRRRFSTTLKRAAESWRMVRIPCASAPVRASAGR